LKGEKFDMVVQKATELGAWRVAPILTKRADVRPRDERDTARRVERWRRLALEASKQSGRARVPSVAGPVAFDSFAAVASRAGELRALFAERGGVSLDSFSVDGESGPEVVTALVGAVGGWGEQEIELVGARGWASARLGGTAL